LPRDAQNAAVFVAIVSIRHKGLCVLFEEDGIAGVLLRHVPKRRLQLVALDTAHTIEDMKVPGCRLHRLTGQRASTWSISVDRKWKPASEFVDANVYLLDYEHDH